MRRWQAIAVAIMLGCMFVTSPGIARYHHQRIADANGNQGYGVGSVTSHKTGASARVGWQYATKFQGYVDAIEATGATVYFMGGIRRGHCSNSSLHPCGKALDVCQTGRGRVAAKCHLPDRSTLARIAEAHGLFEGGQWCHSDYGHAQVGVTAESCGNRGGTLTASARTRRTHDVVATFADPLFPDRITRSY
jgi:hypothetical protein